MAPFQQRIQIQRVIQFSSILVFVKLIFFCCLIFPSHENTATMGIQNQRWKIYKGKELKSVGSETSFECLCIQKLLIWQLCATTQFPSSS